MMRAYNNIIDIIFPKRCIFCKKVVKSEKMVCAVCNNVIEEKYIIADDYAYKTIKRAAFAFKYDGIIRTAIINYKFKNKRHYSEVFSDYIYKKLSSGGFEDIDYITYVPLGLARYLKRGYNQTYLIANKISQLMDKPLIKTLCKNKFVTRQSDLSKKERTKSKNRFKYVYNADIIGKNILLIDDIFTTGSTAFECAELLIGSGASNIYFASVAKVADISYRL